MVGVPRSSGCSVCITRRVKCDEARPFCVKCQNYGVICPGYQKKFKFVDRGHGRQTKLQCNGQESGVQKDHGAAPFTNVSVTETLHLQRKSKVLPPRTFESAITMMINSSAVNQIQCLSILMDDLSKGPSSSPNEATIARMFIYIPFRLGMSSTLDSAIRCLTVHHLGITNGNEEIVRHGRYAYGTALSTLQKAIYDPEKSVASETMCATMILSIYELFACTKGDAWMRHAAGVRRMMLLRGPESFKSEFDISMIVAYRAMLVMEALFSGKKCFLERDEWRDMTLPNPFPSFTQEFYEQASKLGKYLAALPWLVSEGLGLREADISEPSTQQRILALMSHAIDIHGQLIQWYEDFATSETLPEEVPSATNDKLYPVVYRYRDITTSSIFCGYYAFILIVNTILIDVKHPAGNSETLSTNVDNICKSVEYVADSGILGPYRLGFALRIAYELGTSTNRLWIRGWLEKFGKYYKTCSPDNFIPVDDPKTSTELVQDLSNDQTL